MPEKDRKPFVYEPEKFWEERYSSLDITRSGHRDLPLSYNRWLYRRKKKVLRRALSASGFSPKGKRILAVGVGAGAYVDFWKQLGVKTVTGLDICGTTIEYLRRRHPEFKFFKCDITEPDLNLDCGGDFDLVTAIDVLYHVIDDEKLLIAIRNIVNLLKPGGLFALHENVINRSSETVDYIRNRSLSGFGQILNRFGLNIVSTTPSFFTMINAINCKTNKSAKIMSRLWSYLSPCILRAPFITGALTYSIDNLLGAILKEGPSETLILARRH